METKSIPKFERFEDFVEYVQNHIDTLQTAIKSLGIENREMQKEIRELKGNQLREWTENEADGLNC